MSARIRVPVEQLHEHWMSDQARGIANDLKLGLRIVTMADGTQYEAPLAEVRAALDAEEAAESQIVRCAGCGCTDDEACLGGCYWSGQSNDFGPLCSRCAS